LVEKPSIVTTSGFAGDFTLVGAPVNQRFHVLVQGPLQMADTFIDTYSPFFITPEINFGQDALLLRRSDIEPVLQTYSNLNQSQGIIIGRVYDNTEGIPGISILIGDLNGKSISATVGYTNENGEWDPSLADTSQNGTFVVFNIPDVPRDIILTTNSLDMIFDNLEARVYPFVASTEKVTVAPLIGRAVPSTGGSGGGGGCFITEVTNEPVSSPWFFFGLSIPIYTGMIVFRRLHKINSRR
ncbi:MAG: hypothetical protein JRD68_12005, partial [Deltaproteobacteria bacterium]|nr:hypothetical protein [Deltaproteobacteria bacterium]